MATFPLKKQKTQKTKRLKRLLLSSSISVAVRPPGVSGGTRHSFLLSPFQRATATATTTPPPPPPGNIRIPSSSHPARVPLPPPTTPVIRAPPRPIAGATPSPIIIVVSYASPSTHRPHLSIVEAGVPQSVLRRATASVWPIAALGARHSRLLRPTRSNHRRCWGRRGPLLSGGCRFVGPCTGNVRDSSIIESAAYIGKRGSTTRGNGTGRDDIMVFDRDIRIKDSSSSRFYNST